MTNSVKTPIQQLQQRGHAIEVCGASTSRTKPLLRTLGAPRYSKLNGTLAPNAAELERYAAESILVAAGANMSLSINVYAVSLEQLKQVVGSHDQAIIDAIVEGHEDFLSTIDDIDVDAKLTCADAVAELINGELSEDAPGYLYGYAVEAICRRACPKHLRAGGFRRASHLGQRAGGGGLLRVGNPAPLPTGRAPHPRLLGR
jgi:hypothetical protein